MVWVRLNDEFAEHPKVAGLSDEAFRTHVEFLCYCARNLTDGKIPNRLAAAQPGFLELIEARVWDQRDGGVWVHDFLDLNPSRAEVEKLRADRSSAGRRGGQASAQAKARASAQAKSNPVPVPVPLEGSSSPSENLSNSGAESDDLWAKRWNGVCLGTSIPAVKKLAGRRAPRLRAFVKSYGEDAVLLAMRWFAARGLTRDNGTAYGIDTFLVPAKREVYIEASGLWDKAGRPENNGRARSQPGFDWDKFWTEQEA